MNYTREQWRGADTPYARVVADNKVGVAIGIANCYDPDFLQRPLFWQAKVNAQLIAAAPDLYEALKAVLYASRHYDLHDEDNEAFANANRALNKAEGSK